MYIYTYTEESLYMSIYVLHISFTLTLLLKYSPIAFFFSDRPPQTQDNTHA